MNTGRGAPLSADPRRLDLRALPGARSGRSDPRARGQALHAEEPGHVHPSQPAAVPRKADKPDPLFAKMLQEPLGGQWGEISVMMTYLFQGWNCRGPQKYKDMIMDIGTEEIGHVEMLATMIARLLETSPVEDQEDAAKNSIVGAVMGGARVEDAIIAGMNPQHYIVSGLGARPSTASATRGRPRTSSRAATCWPTSASTSRPRARDACRSRASTT
jgi:hypothetical protein